MCLHASKCVYNKEVAHEATAECVTDVLTTFWRFLWPITEQTHGNMETNTSGKAFFMSSVVVDSQISLI